MTSLLEAVITVKEAGAFKPCMKVYKLASERFGTAPVDITFYSSNR